MSVVSQGDYFETENTHWGERNQKMGTEGQILAQYKKELSNSQHWPTTARAALGMMSFPSLEVCKQG